MQGVDTPEKLEAVRAAVAGKPRVTVAFANSVTRAPGVGRWVHDDYEEDQMRKMAKLYGLDLDIARIPPVDEKSGRTLDVVFREAVARGDIVMDYESYWDDMDGDARERAAAVVKANPDTLFVLPYGERPFKGAVPPTSTSLQGMALKADGKGFANMLLTIPVVHGQPGRLTGISRRTKGDTETAALVSPTGWAMSTGDTCPSAAMAAIVAAWIYAARDRPPAADVIRILVEGRRLPSVSAEAEFSAEDREALKKAIEKKNRRDAMKRRELLHDGAVSLGGVLEILPKAHRHEWTAWRTNETATCTADGSRTRTCRGRGCLDRRQAQTVFATGHEWGEWAPDPKSPGRECRRCGRERCRAKETRKAAAQ